MKGYKNQEEVHTDDIKDIIASPPSWLLQWGILLVLFVLITMTLLSAFIRYPDIVLATVRVNSYNAPKPVVPKMSGSLVHLLVKENDWVDAGQELAWIESTADHLDVSDLRKELAAIRDNEIEGYNAIIVDVPARKLLGELQSSYHSFYQSYLNYKAAAGNGILVKRIGYLYKDIKNIKSQREQLIIQQNLQKDEFALAEIEMKRFERLVDQKVVSASEYEKQQGVLLGKRYPLEQTQFTLLVNDASYNSKIKELADLENQISEEKARFMQALNSLISEIDHWKSRHVLTANQSGLIVYGGVIQENQHIVVGQEVFYINPESTDFFGEISLPQYNMGKVEVNQKVLIKLNSFPFQEYGVLGGIVSQVNNIPQSDSLFNAQIVFDSSTIPKLVTIRAGMEGTAEIITQDLSLLGRVYRNMNKIMHLK